MDKAATSEEQVKAAFEKWHKNASRMGDTPPNLWDAFVGGYAASNLARNRSDGFDAHANLIETLNNPSKSSDKELEAACDALVRLSQIEKAPRYQACDIFGRGWYDITKEGYDICKNRCDKPVRVVT